MLSASQHAQTHHMCVIVRVLYVNRYICKYCFINLDPAEMSQSPPHVSWFFQNSWREVFDLAFERLGLEDVRIPSVGV